MIFKPGSIWPTFLEIAFVWEVNMSVYVPLRLLTNGMIWTPCEWLLVNKFYSFHMVAAVDIISRHGLKLKYIIETNLLRIS